MVSCFDFRYFAAVIHGKPSSSVIISQDGKPLLMADVGAGVLKPCREKLGTSDRVEFI